MLLAILDEILKDTSKLTDKQLSDLLHQLEVEKSKRENGKTPSESIEIKAVCPECGSISVVKCGKTNAGTQRYKCKDCKKVFTPAMGSIFKYSRLTEAQWSELIRGIVSGLSLSKIAQNIGTSTKAAWYNKTKIATTLSQIYVEQDKFIDIAECDECFMHLSFKGKRNPDFFINTLHRMPRHHRSKEEKEEYLQKAGLWEEVSSNNELYTQLMFGDYDQPGTNRDNVCILSGKDRSGNLYINPVCVGSIESKHVVNHFEDRFAEDAILVTDSNTAYNWFAEEANIHHEQILSEKHVNGPYSLSRINAVHSNLRMQWPKKGNNHPATKYLDLGLILFWWMEKNKDLTPQQQAEELLACISSLQAPNSPITYVAIKNRPLPLDTKKIIPDYV